MVKNNWHIVNIFSKLPKRSKITPNILEKRQAKHLKHWNKVFYMHISTVQLKHSFNNMEKLVEKIWKNKSLKYIQNTLI